MSLGFFFLFQKEFLKLNWRDKTTLSKEHQPITPSWRDWNTHSWWHQLFQRSLLIPALLHLLCIYRRRIDQSQKSIACWENLTHAWWSRTTSTRSALTHRICSAPGLLNDSELPLMVSLNQNFHLDALSNQRLHWCGPKSMKPLSRSF